MKRQIKPMWWCRQGTLPVMGISSFRKEFVRKSDEISRGEAIHREQRSALESQKAPDAGGKS